MASKFSTLTDQQLVEAVKAGGAEVMIGWWPDPKSGRFETGIRDALHGRRLALSSHDDEEAAKQAARDLEVRLDRLARERGDLAVNNLFDRTGKTKH